MKNQNVLQGNEESFGAVVDFVNRHSELIVLSDAAAQSAIAVWPAMQGRVLTSTATGAEGPGFGWINRDLIASGEIREHINAYGGEDRLWLGPEGGQFSIFFAPGVPFDLDHWYTPAPIDTEPFEIVKRDAASITFRRAFQLTNFSAANFHIQLEREVRLLSSERIWQELGIAATDGIQMVGYESVNKLVNLADTPWSEKSGLLSIWVLGQFQSSAQTTIVLPFHAGTQAALGTPVTTDYFGEIPAGRIALHEDSVFLKADGGYRCKLGLSPRRATGVLGSYDAANRTLTIVQHSLPAGAEKYVNSAWKMQDDPYGGDVTNCYNDGPPAPGKDQLGKFYELESSSLARELQPQEAIEHTHRTIHLVGAEKALDAICQAVLGTRIEEIHSFNP